MFNPDKYRSVTWQKGGRVFPHLDCYGVIAEIRSDLALPAWPDFYGVTKDDEGLDKAAKNFTRELTRCDPCEGAGVECYTGSTVTHVGIVVNIDGLLYVAECNPKSNVTFMPLARFIRHRFLKVEFWK